ncbi:MAG: hypothetical protein JWM80_3158 [Cyanobacteria bacterium RYN_339]|nr:hypothetical protein [Cyanobacteria bacterium RYN_339]
MAASLPTLPVQGYYPPTGGAPLAPVAPVAPQPYAAPAIGQDVRVNTIGNGPVLPTAGPSIIGMISRGFPAGTQAAIGAAEAIAAHSSGAMAKGVAKIVGEAGEPLLHLTLDLTSNLFGFVGNLITFNFPKAAESFINIFKMGAVNTGNLVKRAVQPVSLTAAVSGGSRLNPASALATGLGVGLKALKSSFIWAIPSAAIQAFVDYKYHDQSDTKRLATNFVADVVGYTGAGMAGAAAGAFIGSMTMPIVGTIVGAGVGILLGMLHEKTTRPLISDALRDRLG